MNFQTLTAGHHVVTHLISHHFDDDLCPNGHHQLVMQWIAKNYSGQCHAFVHRGDGLLDFMHLYENDISGSPTWYENDWLAEDTLPRWLETVSDELELLDERDVTIKFVFAEANDAMLFKLSWGGQ